LLFGFQGTETEAFALRGRFFVMSGSCVPEDARLHLHENMI